MSNTRAEDRRSPFPVRDGRAVIIRVLMPSRPLCAQARDVRQSASPILMVRRGAADTLLLEASNA
jgi:hypothetical protein